MPSQRSSLRIRRSVTHTVAAACACLSTLRTLQLSFASVQASRHCTHWISHHRLPQEECGQWRRSIGSQNCGQPGLRARQPQTAHRPVRVKAATSGSAPLVMATMAALSLSCDDVMWFMAFMTGKNRLRNGILYVIAMEFNVVFASLLKWISIVVGKALDVSLSRWLQVASAAAISFYTLLLFREWRAERAVGKQDESENAEEDVGRQGRSPKDLFIIAFLGSFDNFAVFLSLLLSGTLSAFQLFGGVAVQSLIVVLICGGLGGLAPVARLVDKIPLWVIIGALALWCDVALFWL